MLNPSFVSGLISEISDYVEVSNGLSQTETR